MILSYFIGLDQDKHNSDTFRVEIDLTKIDSEYEASIVALKILPKNSASHIQSDGLSLTAIGSSCRNQSFYLNPYLLYDSNGVSAVYPKHDVLPLDFKFDCPIDSLRTIILHSSIQDFYLNTTLNITEDHLSAISDLRKDELFYNIDAYKVLKTPFEN